MEKGNAKKHILYGIYGEKNGEFDNQGSRHITHPIKKAVLLHHLAFGPPKAATNRGIKGSYMDFPGPKRKKKSFRGACYFCPQGGRYMPGPISVKK